MEDMEVKGCVCRIRKCAFDLLSMEEDLVVDDDHHDVDDIDDDDDNESSWDLIGREFRLKAAFLYCDLSKVISSAKDDRKKALADLGNKLLYFMEELDRAVKSRSISLTQVCYSDAAHALHEVMAALVPSN